MGDKSKGLLEGLARQLPAAVLVFLAFGWNNMQWAGHFDEAMRGQVQYMQRLTDTIEKLTSEVVQVHAHIAAKPGGS